MSEMDGEAGRPRETLCQRCGNAIANVITLYPPLPDGSIYDFWLCDGCAAKAKAIEEAKAQLRQIAGRYSGPGEAIEETLISLWRNPEAARLRDELRAFGLGDRQIESEAFRKEQG
jgi:hypothetical protein